MYAKVHNDAAGALVTCDTNRMRDLCLSTMVKAACLERGSELNASACIV